MKKCRLARTARCDGIDRRLNDDVETVAGALLVHDAGDSVNSIAATARCRIDPRDTS
jgi:hypothetical protein